MATERRLNMDEFLKRFEFLGANLPKAVYNAMLASAKVMLASVTRKLRGEYLNVQTGRGWQSMQDFARFSGDRMQAGIDTDVIYMKAHELGFHGRVQVRAHTRQMFGMSRNVRGLVTRASARNYKRSRAAGRAQIVYVRAHTMQMNIRARRFMRDTIDQQFDPTQDRIQRAIILAARTGAIPTVSEIGA